jgi:hypothetical protein
MLKSPHPSHDHFFFFQNLIYRMVISVFDGFSAKIIKNKQINFIRFGSIQHGTINQERDADHRQ